MKSLLIVTEAFEVGGLETHIKGEIVALTRLGCRVHLATGPRFNRLLLPPELVSVTSHLPLGPEATLADLRQTVDALRHLLCEHAIDVIHVHPFTSFVPSLLAAELEGVPSVLTLHGPASFADYLGPLYNFIFYSSVLPCAGLIVAVSNEVADLVSPYISSGQLCRLANGVDVNVFSPPTHSSECDARWLVVSRLDSCKVVGVADFILKAKAAGVPGVLLVGDGPSRGVLEEELNSNHLTDFVEFLGASADVPSLMQSVSGVAGMGRVVLEGLSSGKPVCLVGYDGVKGLCDRDLVSLASQANFSGRNLTTITDDTFIEQIAGLAHVDSVSLRHVIEQEFSEAVLWAGFFDRLKRLNKQKSTFLSDLYRVVLAHLPSEAAPFLQSHVLLEQVGKLIHSPKHFQPVVVANYLYHREQSRDAKFIQVITERDGQIAGLSQAVVERDGQIASLNQTVVERDGQVASLHQIVVERDGQIANLNQTVVERDGQIVSLNQMAFAAQSEIAAIKASISWSITRPLRFAKRFIQDPKRASYSALKFMYWRLPSFVRQFLWRPRYTFVRWASGFLSPAPSATTTGGSHDLTWEEFQSQVLCRRSEFKGIFVQELVIDWNVPLYQRPQHIAAAFGRKGYLVIYKTGNWLGDDINGFRQVSENVWITNGYEVNSIIDVFRSVYSTSPVNSPESLLENGRRGIIIYEYVDHIDPMISGDSENVTRLVALKNFAFGGGADFVVASSRILEAEAVAALGRDKVVFVPNGVDTRHYRHAIHQNTSLPERLLIFKRKYANIVGYFGALAPWLWYEVIAELVEDRPELGFIFIGPDYYGGAKRLPVADNVLYLGSVDYKILPMYANQFDVCFIPFAPGEIARTTSPLKLFEYFALEKPVVVTSEMNECTSFKEVFSGDSAKALSQAIDRAISIKSNPAFKASLAQLADENDWDERVRAMEVVFTMEHDSFTSRK